jgi:hypothetical protein
MRTPIRLRRTERLAQDQAMRVIAGWRGPGKPAASTNSMSRTDKCGAFDFETEVLTPPENLEGLARLNTRWVQQGMARTTHRRIISDKSGAFGLDMDIRLRRTGARGTRRSRLQRPLRQCLLSPSLHVQPIR